MNNRRKNNIKNGQRQTISKSGNSSLASLARAAVGNPLVKSLRLSPLPVSITNLTDSKFIEVSDSFLDIFGCSRDEIIGSTAFELGLYQQLNEDGLDFNIFRERKPLNKIKVRLKTKTDGEHLFILTSDIINLDNCQYILCYYEIITNCNKTIKALRESEEKYRSLIEKSIDAVYIIANNRFKFVNRKFIEMFGWPETEICSPDFDMMCLVAPSSISFMKNRLNKIKRGEKVPEHYEYTAISRDGKEIHLEVFVSYLSYNGQKAIQGIYHNISDRKKAEKELIKFKTITDKANYGIAMSDPYGNITYINEYFAGIHGYTYDEIIGKNLSTFHNEKQLPKVLEINRGLLKNGSYTNLEVWHTHRDGHVFPMLMNGVVITDDTQKPLYFATTAIDITETKQTEKIVSAQHNLNVALSAVSSLNEALELCLDYIIKISDMKSCGIYLVTENKGLNLITHRGLSKEFVKLAGYYEPDSPQVRLVMAGKPVYSLYSSLNLPLADSRNKEKLKHISIIPLVHEGEVIACFNVSSHVHQDIPDSIKRALETIAAQVSSAICRLQTEHELHKLEEKYRLVVENANEAIIVFQNNELKYANPRTFELSGYSKSEMFPKKFINYFHPDDKKMIIENFAKRVKGMDKPLKYSFRFTNKNGSIQWLEISTTLITWEGKPASLGFINDITEEKIAEQELQNEREFISSLLDTANSLIVCLDKDARIIVFNKEIEKLTGYKREEVIGKYWPDIFLPEFHHHHKIKDFALWVKKHPRDKYEGPLVTKTGETKTILWSNSAIFHSGPNEITAIAVGQDITNRKQAKEMLKASEEKYRHLVENSGQPIFSIDKNGVFLMINENTIEVTGGKLDDYLGKSLWDVFPKDFADKRYARTKKAIDSGNTITYTSKMSFQGIERWFTTNVYPVYPDNGDTPHAIHIGTDITDRKLVEETLKASEEKYRLLIENAGQPIFSVDENGVYLTMNKLTASLIGGKPDDYIGKSYWDIFPKKFADLRYNNTKKTIDLGKKLTFTLKMVIEGQERWFIINIHPIYPANGDIPKALHIASEITELKLREFKERAVTKLLDNLRRANNINDCLSFGCRSIYNARLYKRSVLTMHNREKEIIHFGQFGLDDNTVRAVMNNPAPSDEMTFKMTQKKFKINHSYFIPVESGLLAEYVERTIPQEENFTDNELAWKTGDEFFAPILSSPKKPEGWLSVDTPFNGKRPTSDEAAFLQEIVEIVSKKVHEIQSLNLLKTERRALQEKNIALREVLAHIEEEKMEIKNLVRDEIDSTLMPALSKMINADGKVNKIFYNIVHNCLQSLANSSGEIQHIYSKLSPREVEICSMIKNGTISKDIATALNISIATVQKHREIIRKKLGITNKNINLATYLQR
ncbi:MAG: PAS domain S-box protein [candidate division Zixibacteria bacterium]|nr:PAS domain S-box protein [candidate division Zixibacteria bacterium]